MKHTTKLFLIVLLVGLLVALFTMTATASSTPIAQEHHFNELEQAIYDELSDYICSVANGTLTSTQFTITSDLSDLSYTKAQIGCTISSNGSITSAAKNALGEKIKEDIDFSYLVESLKKDFPYEFFWAGNSLNYQYTFQGNTSRMWVTSLTISIRVSEDYRPANTTSEYRVSPNEITRGHAAAENAKAIVAQYADKSDLEKLKAYYQEICLLTAYNSAAAAGDHPYGDPWNLVYVFDGDPDTKVVCEGYAKAFKYLCDLSTFDKDIACYIAIGDNHMWNVVGIDGCHYLVDVSFEMNDFFLAGGVSSEGGKAHTISFHKYCYYDSRDDYLILSETNYHEHYFSTSWFSDGEQHWHTCSSCGERADEALHTSSTAATCTQKAVCEICHTAFGELLPHVYDQEVASARYLQSKATCTTPATYYYSCVCGAKGTETFTPGSVDFTPDSADDSVSGSSPNSPPNLSSTTYSSVNLGEVLAELLIWFFKLLFGIT